MLVKKQDYNILYLLEFAVFLPHKGEMTERQQYNMEGRGKG